MAVRTNKAAEERAPRWAVQFLNVVADDFDRAAPPLRWATHDKDPNQWSSNGHCAWNSVNSEPDDCYIFIRAGSDILDQIETLVHEAAHWIAGPNADHGEHYWRTYWKLVKEYELPFYYCYYRSARYRAMSEHVAKRLYKIPRAADLQLILYNEGDMPFRPEPFYANWNPINYPWRQLARITLGTTNNPAPPQPRLTVTTPPDAPQPTASQRPASTFHITSITEHHADGTATVTHYPNPTS